MNLKTTYILFGVLLAALLTFLAFQFWGSNPRKGDTEDALFPEFTRIKDPASKSDIESVRIERNSDGKSESMLFVHNDGNWQIREPVVLRADPFQVDNVVSQITSAHREKSEMSSDLAQYGLDHPAVVITLKKGDAEWRLNVGKQAPGTGGVVYVSTGVNPNEPAAVRKSSLESVFRKLSDFRARDLLDSKVANIQEVRLVEPKGPTLALKKNDKGAWRFETPAYGSANESGTAAPPGPAVAAKKINGVRDLIDEAGNLRVETPDDFIKEGVSDGDLAGEYGLAKDAPETLRIEIKSKAPEESEKTQVLLIGKKTEKVSEDKKDEKKDDKDKKPETKTDYYFARLENENAVVRVPAAKVKPLLDVASIPEPLRNRDLITFSFPAKPDAIDVQAGSELAKLRLSGFEWKLYQNGSHPADQQTVRELIDGITGKPAAFGGPFGGEKQSPVKTFVDKNEGIDWSKPARVVKIWVDGIKKEEKKEEKEGEKSAEEKKEDKEPELTSQTPTVTLTFVNQKDLVYVKRETADGEKTIVTVADTLLDKIPGDRLAFFDKQLPTFSSSLDPNPTKDVTKVALYQDVVFNDKATPKWAVTKEKDGDKPVWKFAQPSAGRIADSFATEKLISNLAGLRAIKIVNEKAADLAPYGLAAPKATFVVTVKKGDKSEDWIYTFGGEKKYSDKKAGEKPNTTVTEEKTGIFAKINKSDVVFLVSKETVDALQSRELRDLTVFNFDLKKVKGAEITVWSNDLGAPVTLKLERKGDDDWAKKEAPFDSDSKKVESLIRIMSQLKASRFVTIKAADEKTGLDVKKKALKVKVDVDGGPMELIVGNEDPDTKGTYFATGTTGAARPAGQEEVFLVPEGLFKEAKSGPAYFRKP
jgi:hypothetical protein